jgi:glycosyltransferase involved in cell wall biosynthesis
MPINRNLSIILAVLAALVVAGGLLAFGVSQETPVGSLKGIATARELGVPDPRVVPSGVDVPDAVGEPDVPLHVLFVGRLSEEKGVLELLEATQGIPRVVVGDGPLRPALEGRPGITVAGRVPHAQVRQHVAAARVVCQPSLVEPFGQALVEAMACGRSVVATSVGGPPEFVTPEAGVLVDPLSVTAIAEGLRRAARLPCPNPAARAIAESHDVRRRAEQIESVLERAAAI